MTCEHEIGNVKRKKGWLGLCRKCYNKKYREDRLDSERVRKRLWHVQNSVWSRFHATRRGAEKRGLEFSLNIEFLKDLMSRPCVYGKNSTVVATRVGADRVDNTLGYTLSNCVPCCAKHNDIKGRWLTFREMLFVVDHVDSAKDCGDKEKQYA
jgi:hypothetical protein